MGMRGGSSGSKVSTSACSSGVPPPSPPSIAGGGGGGLGGDEVGRSCGGLGWRRKDWTEDNEPRSSSCAPVRMGWEGGSCG